MHWSQMTNEIFEFIFYWKVCSVRRQTQEKSGEIYTKATLVLALLALENERRTYNKCFSYLIMKQFVIGFKQSPHVG